jgi:neutral ceramidase
MLVFSWLPDWLFLRMEERLMGRCFLLVCLIAVGCAQTASAADAHLRAGAAKKAIVPPFPTQMGGFTDRVKNFEGVHDELFARALVLDDGTTKLVFIGSDLMAIDAAFVRLAREQITRTTGIPASNILICCTHNHSAPSYYQKAPMGQDDAEPSLKQFLLKQFVAVALEAERAMVPARAGFAAGNLEGVTRNRQQKNNLIDPQVGVLRVEEQEGRATIATLFNFTGHPVILGANNLMLSGEYPGAAARAVETLLSGVAISTQGACGDITVNRSGDPFLEIERLGRTLAGEVIKTSGLVKLREDMSLKAATKSLRLPARRRPSLEEAKCTLEQGQAVLEAARKQNAPAAITGLLDDKNRVRKMAVVMAQKSADDPSKQESELEAEVQVVQVGNVTYGAIPGELFVEYALELRSRVKQDTGNWFCLVGYANGYLGYILTPRGIETGGYEASVTRLDALAGRTMTENMIGLVHQLSMQGIR